MPNTIQTDLNVNELAATAATALKALNDFYSGYAQAARHAGSYQAVVRAPDIADHLHIELCQAMVAFDCDPAGTLEELTRTEEPEWNGRWPRPSDCEWEFQTSRGVGA